MLRIIEKNVFATFEFTDETYKITGDFKKSASGTLKESSMNIFKVDDSTSVGYANAYEEGSDIKYNLSGVKLENIEAVSKSVKACAQAIHDDNTLETSSLGL